MCHCTVSTGVCTKEQHESQCPPSSSSGFTSVKGFSWNVRVRETCGCDASVTTPCLFRVTTWTERRVEPLETLFTKSTPVLTSRYVHGSLKGHHSKLTFHKMLFFLFWRVKLQTSLSIQSLPLHWFCTVVVSTYCHCLLSFPLLSLVRGNHTSSHSIFLTLSLIGSLW